MLSYQHAYHAGNHADLLKHFVLTFVLDSLNIKDKPYTFFDTHSGSGLYDLLDDRSIKTSEAANGISKLLQNEDMIEELACYISFVKKYTDNKRYPGSPEIEKQFLRQQDTLILSELHPAEYENLKNNITCEKGKAKLQIHKRNGWEMIKALTPPVTKRGGVLIDPSYEEVKDYTDAAEVISFINRKWSNGIILLWYPLLSHRENEIDTMVCSIIENARKVNPNVEIENLKLCVFDKDAHVETSLDEVLKDEDKKNPPRLYGSGMLVINAPWKLGETASKVINYIESKLKN